MKKKQFTFLFLSLLILGYCSYAQDLKFKEEKKIPTTPVKNQLNTGTCWSFATTSFIETELLRLGKGTYDLSEMYFVRNAYEAKAERFMHLQGIANLSQGGQAHDVFNVVRNAGIVPEEAYKPLQSETETENHNELEAFLNGGLKGIIANKPRIISPAWKAGFNGVLDAYMGKKPEQFTYNGKSYSPKSFAAELGINPDDYIELTSYSHHPYYRPFPLEVQDNWSNDLYYNLPIKELIEVINNAIDNGYSVCWDGDVSEREFLHQSGIATLTKPESLSFDDYRQSTFNNWSTTDDHLMHIVGKAIDKNGKAYYYTKNSWGSESNKLGGFLYMSEDYLQVKTIAILVNKKSIPSSINEKLFGKQ